MSKIFKTIISKRFIILALLGVTLYLAVSQFKISLWYVLLAGTVMGLVFGKVFCRWVCPMGLIMELLMSLSPDAKFHQMYQYHKIGCPIAWISGWLNRYSLFKIEIDEEGCSSCGLCDKKCYIVAMEPQKFSLYKPSKVKPGETFTCSKCLECVAACPNGSLKFRT